MSRVVTFFLALFGFAVLGAFFLGLGWVLVSWGVPLPLTGLVALAAMAGVFVGLQKWAGPTT